MHIPDGFLSPTVWVATDVAAIAAVGLAVRKARKEIDDHLIPLMGVTAAFVFGAQMLNFPVIGGTSGHVLGGLLTALLVGPNAAILVMTVVLFVQAFLFGDGGILALGANILNMAVIGAWLCYWLYRWLAKVWRRKWLAAIVAWLSVVLGSIACGLEIAFSGTVPLFTVVPAMAGIHAVIGIGEALVTVSAFNFVKRLRPEILQW